MPKQDHEDWPNECEQRFYQLAELFQRQRRLGGALLVRLLGTTGLMLVGLALFVYGLARQNYLVAMIMITATLLLGLTYGKRLNGKIAEDYERQLRAFADGHPKCPAFYERYAALMEQSRMLSKYDDIRSLRL